MTKAISDGGHWASDLMKAVVECDRWGHRLGYHGPGYHDYSEEFFMKVVARIEKQKTLPNHAVSVTSSIKGSSKNEP